MGEFLEYQDQPGEREGKIQWLHLLDLGFLWLAARPYRVLVLLPNSVSREQQL